MPVKEIMQDSVIRWATAEAKIVSDWASWKQPPGKATGKPAADSYAESHGLPVRNSALVRARADQMLNMHRIDHIAAVLKRYGVK